MIDELIFGGLVDLDDEEPTPDVFLERSRTAELWATSEEFEHEDREMQVSLLVLASEQATAAGETERALTMAQQAVAGAEKLGDWLVPDVRIRLFDCLRRTGRDAEAADVERDLRKRLPDAPESFDEMGQVLSDLRDAKLAERWYTMGIRFAEDHDLTEDFAYELLVVSRSELRKGAGTPPDEFDVLAEEIVDDWDLESGN